MANTTLPDGWDLDQDSTSKYQDWQGTQLAMGGPSLGTRVRTTDPGFDTHGHKARHSVGSLNRGD